MILQGITSNERILTSNKQRVKSYVSLSKKERKKQEKTDIKIRLCELNKEQNRQKADQNLVESDDDNRRMITTTSRFIMHKEVTLRKKIKPWNEELLVLKHEKENNLRIFYNTTAFEKVKEIIENTVRKNNKDFKIYKMQRYKTYKIEDHEGRYNCEKKSRRHQIIFAVNTYCTKSSLFRNGPQKPKFILEAIPVIKLWELENKTAVNISDRKLKRVLVKSKIDKQLSKVGP